MTLRDELLEDYREGLFDLCMEARLGNHLGFCQRFFTPTKKFFQTLIDLCLQDQKFVDCGTGLGYVPHELRAHGFKAVGVDLCTRDGQKRDVVVLDSRHYPFGAGTVCLICRPSHDGFAELTAKKALVQGSPVIYVGLESNFVRDMGTLAEYLHFKQREVGKEGEVLYYFEAPRSVNKT